jgi:hypothetical protein
MRIPLRHLDILVPDLVAENIHAFFAKICTLSENKKKGRGYPLPFFFNLPGFCQGSLITGEFFMALS